MRKSASLEDSSFTIQQGALMAVMFLAVALTVQATQPGWWTATGGPLNSSPANDYMVANQGQLKQFTQKAVLYMDTNLPGGAGTTLDCLVAGWSNYYATNGYSSTNPAPADFKAVNQGQLKYVASLVWSNLVTAGYTNALPSWIAVNTNSDYMVVNGGQLKTVFNFDLTDSDTNGLYDWWEMEYFGALGNDPNSSPDGNGYTLAQDYASGANPTNYYSQPNGSGGALTVIPSLTILGGNNQTSTPGNYTDSPLLVKITNSSGGAALVNAPITFTVTSGTGQVISGLSGSSLGSSSSVITDGSGDAQVYFQQPATAGTTNTIVASAGGQTINFTETTSADDGTFDAPSQVVAHMVSETEIDLSWVNHASTATSIIIRQSSDHNATWTVVATLGDPTATSYAVTNLTPGTVYNFGVSGSK